MPNLVNPYRFTAPAVGGFVPTDVAGCELWFDFSDTSQITHSSGAVSQVDDKSGNANHVTQSTGSLQPTTGTSTLNGLNVLDFSSDRLETTSDVAVVTLFFVLKSSNGSDTSGAIFPFCGETLGGGDYIFTRTSTSYDISIDGGGSGDGAEAGNASFNGGSFVTGTNINLSLSNAQIEGTGIWVVRYNKTVNFKYLAAFDNGASLFNGIGEIAEVVAYDSTLATSDVNDIGDYLGTKWGISWTDI